MLLYSSFYFQLEPWFSLRKPHIDLYFDSEKWEIFIVKEKEKGESASKHVT